MKYFKLKFVPKTVLSERLFADVFASVSGSVIISLIFLIFNWNCSALAGDSKIVLSCHGVMGSYSLTFSKENDLAVIHSKFENPGKMLGFRQTGSGYEYTMIFDDKSSNKCRECTEFDGCGQVCNYVFKGTLFMAPGDRHVNFGIINGGHFVDEPCDR